MPSTRPILLIFLNSSFIGKLLRATPEAILLRESSPIQSNLVFLRFSTIFSLSKKLESKNYLLMCLLLSLLLVWRAVLIWAIAGNRGLMKVCSLSFSNDLSRR